MNERGSTIPLVLGFVIIGLFGTGAAVAAGDAFVQQRGLQAVCDGAAAAGAASAIDLARDAPVADGGYLRFAAVQSVVQQYLARDPERQGVQVDAEVSDDGRTLSLVCVEQERIAFGAVFGRASGVRHVVHSSAQAPLAGGQ